MYIEPIHGGNDCESAMRVISIWLLHWYTLTPHKPIIDPCRSDASCKLYDCLMASQDTASHWGVTSSMQGETWTL